MVYNFLTFIYLLLTYYKLRSSVVEDDTFLAPYTNMVIHSHIVRHSTCPVLLLTVLSRTPPCGANALHLIIPFTLFLENRLRETKEP